MKIPFSKVSIGEEEIEAVTRVLKSGWLAAGPETEKFEREFAKYVGVKYAIFTNSCTSALKMAYKMMAENPELLGYQIGKVSSEVKTSVTVPKNTFCATYAAAVEMGLEPIMYDPKNYTMNWLRVNMHYGGVKDTSSCWLEDSAHRIEPNDPLIGKIRCYSFYATKNMTTGSGGMFVTNSQEIYEKARLWWRDGLSTSTRERATKGYDYKVLAYAGGYDGNDLAATIGRVQLRKLSSFTKRRNEIVRQYNSSLHQEWTGNHLYPFFVQNKKEVDSLIAFMADNGVACSYHYPNTGWLGVSLPLYPDLTDKEVDYIIRKVGEWRKDLSNH